VARAGARRRGLDPCLGPQIGETQRASPSQRVVGRQRQEHRVLEQRLADEAGRQRIARAGELEQQREVELTGVEPRGDLLGLTLGERQLDLGVLSAEHRDRERHQCRPGGRERCHPQLPAAQAGDRLHVGFGGGEPAEDPLGVRQQRRARGREPHAARQALDQRDPRLGLQCRDLLRDRGLRVGQLLGGSGDRTLLGDLDENL